LRFFGTKIYLIGTTVAFIDSIYLFDNITNSLENMKKLLFALSFIAVAALQAQKIDASYANNGTFRPGIKQYYGAEKGYFTLANGNVLIAGVCPENNSQILGNQFLMRMLPNGKLDPSFGNNGISINDIQPNRINVMHSITALNDGKILMAVGHYNNSATSGKEKPYYRAAIVRFEANGKLDRSFGDNGTYLLPIDANLNYLRILQSSNGNILISAEHSNKTSQEDSFEDIVIVCLRADGSLNTQWGNNGILNYDYDDKDPSGSDHNETPFELIALPNNEVLINANFYSQVNKGRTVFLKVKANGQIDKNYGVAEIKFPQSNVDYWSGEVSPLQADGKILIGGQVSFKNGTENVFLGKLNLDGSFDKTFGSNGLFLAPAKGKDFIVKPTTEADGKIIMLLAKITEFSNGGAILRLLPNGKRDNTFGTNGETELSPTDAESNYWAYGEKDKLFIFGSGEEALAITRYNMKGINPNPAPNPNPTPNPTPEPTPEKYETLRTFLHTETTAKNFKMNLKYTQPIDANISILIYDPNNKLIKTHKSNIFQEADDYEEIFTLPRTTMAGTYIIQIKSDKIDTKVKLLISAEKTLKF
jgi:uncharacterized delta-60 repeat protein